MELCFNSMCQQPVTERSSRGWRRRTGDFADLCPRCASAYEDGIFCETFHLNASGWRCCETCGKQIHCGCIVSFHMFVLLDAGGIECMGCARRSFVLTPNPAWPPPLYNHGIPDKVKDHSLKNWSTVVGSGPVPWREAPSWFNNNTSPAELNANTPSQVEVPGGIDRLNAHERLPLCFLDENKNWESSGRIISGSLKSGAFENIENEVSGNKYKEQPTTCINVTHQSDFSILEPLTQTTHFGLALNPEFRRQIAEKDKVSGIRAHVIPPPAIGNCFPSSSGVGSNGKAQTHNGNAREDGQVRNQLPPRNWPGINNQEVQAISRHPRATIAPLFEKTLTASDAGRMGRLVLPKKCAEAYFPEISNPEGMPLMIQDMRGKKWVFQFRFWPNNSSRMYVLEGVTPCIQSMQLIAGDAVTFSRLEPEGTLVMGGRKYPTLPGNQSKKSIHTGNEVLTHRVVTTRASKSGEAISAPIHVEDNMRSSSLLATRQANSADPASRWTEANDVKYLANDVLGGEIFLSKRKNSTLGSKSKRLRIGNDQNQIIELEITLKEVQGLLRPPSDYAPQIVVIDGNEIAEFEEPPIIGRPTILATDCMGGKFQWAQCEDCFKWRRVPGDILLPSRWTCYKNSWDPERSSCSAAQELIPKELEDLLITAKKLKSKKQDEPDSVDALEGLDELANLAIHEKGGILPSSQATIKHPRHRPGCTCVACIQSPCGEGPKHKQTCTCNACLTMKCRFQTIMSKRETKQTEIKRQKLQQPEDILLCSDTGNCSSSHEAVTNDGSGHGPYKNKFSESPFKGQIDLNVQPEREEDFSPSDSGGMMRLLQNASDSFPNKQKDLSSSADGFSPSSDSGGMMSLLQSASESSPNKQKSYRLLQSASESFQNRQKDLRLLQSASESFLNEHKDLCSSANGNAASVSGGMMRLLQSASESFLNKQKDPSSSANGNSLVNPALE